MHRTIHGPEREFLTAAEVGRWLGVSLTSFKALVKAGEFPPALRIGGSRRWPWLDPVAYAHLRSRMPQPAPRRGAEPLMRRAGNGVSRSRKGGAAKGR